jgi:hypothetical protein
MEQAAIERVDVRGCSGGPRRPMGELRGCRVMLIGLGDVSELLRSRRSTLLNHHRFLPGYHPVQPRQVLHVRHESPCQLPSTLRAKSLHLPAYDLPNDRTRRQKLIVKLTGRPKNVINEALASPRRSGLDLSGAHRGYITSPCWERVEAVGTAPRGDGKGTNWKKRANGGMGTRCTIQAWSTVFHLLSPLSPVLSTGHGVTLPRTHRHDYLPHPQKRHPVPLSNHQEIAIHQPTVPFRNYRPRSNRYRLLVYEFSTRSGRYSIVKYIRHCF